MARPIFVNAAKIVERMKRMSCRMKLSGGKNSERTDISGPADAGLY